MKTYVQPGDTLTLTAPYDLMSGDGVKVGSVFGVAAGAALTGETVEVALVGVFDLKKTGNQSWSAGNRVYWDDVAREATKTATGNTLIGVATADVGGLATDTIGPVRLNGSF